MTHYTFEKFVGGTALGMALLLLGAHPAKAQSSEIMGNPVQIHITHHDKVKD